jgi:sucrose-6-phosphate hydrolase SacC (GH32 family)
MTLLDAKSVLIAAALVASLWRLCLGGGLRAVPGAQPPQFHFTPAKNWLNDPNGLVYFAGEYHLFHQYNPDGVESANKSWAHAVSRDLVHWEHLPVAIRYGDGIEIWSGSAVVDTNNTSGLGTAKDPPLVAFYTAAGHGKQAQHLAYSTDGRGRTWTQFPGNPVIDENLKEFRDPKVIWHESTKRWVMVVALSDQRKVRFYASPDLKKWTQLSEFGPPAFGRRRVGVPGPLPPHVLRARLTGSSSSTSAGADRRSAAGLNISSATLTARLSATPTPKEQTLWTDYGPDNYAGQTWSDVPPPWPPHLDRLDVQHPLLHGRADAPVARRA